MTRRRGTLGVVLLGCGAASARHSRLLRRMDGVDLAFASRDAERADAYRRRYGGWRCYSDYESALADVNSEVALIATPTAGHRDLAILALQAGKHVIVEKPAFMRAADADIVAATAAAAGRQVLVAENYFYKPIAEHLRRIVRGGDLGEIRFVFLNAMKHQHVGGWRAAPALSGGGALFEGGVHWISFASNIGLDVGEVRAYRAGDDDGPDRSSLVVFRYTNGAVGTLAHSWELAAPFGHLRMSKVQGSLGAVTFESNGLAFIASGKRRSFGLPLLDDPFGFRAMHTDFLTALRSGEPPRFTLEMAQRDLAFLEQAECSMSR